MENGNSMDMMTTKPVIIMNQNNYVNDKLIVAL
jgi:hypothetical protein